MNDSQIGPWSIAVARILLRIRPALLAAGLKRLLRLRRRNLDTDGGRFWIDPASGLGMSLISDGVYEPGMGNILKTVLGPGKVFVDVGANEGYFTVIGSRLVGPQGRVVAVEPQQRLIPVIRTNLELNGAMASIVNAAVSDRHATATLYLAPSTNSGSSSFHSGTRYFLPRQQTETLTLTEILDENRIDAVDLLKMDIEGFEFEAILGSPQLFAEKRIKVIALELHPAILAARGKSVDELASFLARAGYSMTLVGGHTVWTSDARYLSSP